jgi:hypothetical protein
MANQGYEGGYRSGTVKKTQRGRALHRTDLAVDVFGGKTVSPTSTTATARQRSSGKRGTLAELGQTRIGGISRIADLSRALENASLMASATPVRSRQRPLGVRFCPSPASAEGAY